MQWVFTLCKISSSMDEKIRVPVEAGYITAKTALAAKEFGGDAYVKTLAKQGKEAATTGDVPKPTHMTVAAMAKAVKQAPEPIREKLTALIVEGELATPAAVEQKARRLAAERTKRNKQPPADLKVVIVGWTHRLNDWEKEMRDVAPYMDYVEEVPKIAADFRAALTRLIDTAKKLL